MHILPVQQIGSCNHVVVLLFRVEVAVLTRVAHQTCARHSIKPGTPEHGTTVHGTPAEHWNTGRFFRYIVFPFNVIIWSPRAMKHGRIILNSMTEVYMSPNKCTFARGKYLLKVLVVEVQTETSSRFPVTIGCILCCIY